MYYVAISRDNKVHLYKDCGGRKLYPAKNKEATEDMVCKLCLQRRNKEGGKDGEKA